jgi:cell division protein FtsB
MKRLFDLCKNKFFLVTIGFVAWMLIFDKNDLVSQYKLYRDVKDLQHKHDFFQKQTAQAAQELDELTSNKEKLEKFAREKYFMKKDNEDVFVIVTKKRKD